MPHPRDKIAYTMTFISPVVEHWLEREILYSFFSFFYIVVVGVFCGGFCLGFFVGFLFLVCHSNK